MESHYIAHGDLQHGNILVDHQGQIHLIDYDSMFVPALAGKQPYDRGHPNFQHPQRKTEFDSQIDRFPGIVILLALEAMQYDPSLWQDFGLSGENLLFTQKDFLDPDASPLLRRLERIPRCRSYVSRFRDCCKGRFDTLPTIESFFGLTSITIPTASQPVEAWSIVPCFSALDTNSTLNQYNQQQIMIIGQVKKIRYKETKHRRPYAQIIFDNAFSFVALVFSDGLNQFTAAGRTLETLRDRWVKMVLNLNVYVGDQSYVPRPQFIIEYPTQIGVITEGEARQLLLTGTGHIPATPLPTESNNQPFGQQSTIPAARLPQTTYISPRQSAHQPPAPAAKATTNNHKPQARQRRQWGAKAPASHNPMVRPSPGSSLPQRSRTPNPYSSAYTNRPQPPSSRNAGGKLSPSQPASPPTRPSTNQPPPSIQYRTTGNTSFVDRMIAWFRRIFTR